LPFSLHPSGYCVWFNENSTGNLISGVACPLCRRVAGHKPDCPYYVENETTGASSRPKLYDATSVLWAQSKNVYFITFTLPSLPGKKTFQSSPHCADTGDLAITKIFSKQLEAIARRYARRGKRFSYVWISEAQMKRQKKFGGIGDLHFHLVTNQRIEIKWLQAAWSGYFPGAPSKNSVHIESLPAGINSVPAYLVKYLGKGAARRIFSRRFSCSRDLSRLAPIRITHIPDDLKAITEKIITTPSGYEVCLYFFNTQEILEQYGAYMIDEKDYQGTRSGAKFSKSEIESRRFTREIKQNQRRHAEQNGLLPLGLSYST
jgi:hypothetical protein